MSVWHKHKYCWPNWTGWPTVKRHAVIRIASTIFLSYLRVTSTHSIPARHIDWYEMDSFLWTSWWWMIVEYCYHFNWASPTIVSTWRWCAPISVSVPAYTTVNAHKPDDCINFRCWTMPRCWTRKCLSILADWRTVWISRLQSHHGTHKEHRWPRHIIENGLPLITFSTQSFDEGLIDQPARHNIRPCSWLRIYLYQRSINATLTAVFLTLT